MLYRLLIFGCLLSGTTSIAQGVGIQPLKTTEKAADSKIDYQAPGAPMPSFLLIEPVDSTMKKETRHTYKKKIKSGAAAKDIYSELITDKDLDNSANLFIMMFNPTCSHCEEETEMLEKNMNLFKKSNLVLMANLIMRPHLPVFIKAHHTYDFPSMYVGLDSLGFMDKVFSYQALPQINIYDKHRKLLKMYSGETTIDTLKQYIE